MSVPFSNTHLRVPRGFSNILQALAREVLRDQPDDIPTYAAKYFEGLLKEREESGMDYAEWGAKLEDRFYNNHAFKTARPTQDTPAATSSSADDLIESQTGDGTDTTLLSGATSGEMQGLDRDVRGDEEPSSTLDVLSTEAGLSPDDADRGATTAEDSADGPSEAERTAGAGDEDDEGGPAGDETWESRSEPGEVAPPRGVARADVCAQELGDTENGGDGAPASLHRAGEGTRRSGGEEERGGEDGMPSAVDSGEPPVTGEEDLPTEDTGPGVPAEPTSPPTPEASPDPERTADFSGEEERESDTAVEEDPGVPGIDPLCVNDELSNTTPDPEEEATVSEHVERGPPVEEQANEEEEAPMETALTQVSEEKLRAFSLRAEHQGERDAEGWGEDLQDDRAEEGHQEVTAEAVEATARPETEPDPDDEDDDGEDETKDQAKVESSSLRSLTRETEEMELWVDPDEEDEDEAEHGSITDYAAGMEQGEAEDMVNVPVDADDDEKDTGGLEREGLITPSQDDTETGREDLAHLDADGGDEELMELKRELEKEGEEEEGQTAMEANEEAPAESQEREQTPVVEKVEEQTMEEEEEEEEAESKLEEKYFSQAGEAHTVEDKEEEKEKEEEKKVEEEEEKKVEEEEEEEKVEEKKVEEEEKKVEEEEEKKVEEEEEEKKVEEKEEEKKVEEEKEEEKEEEEKKVEEEEEEEEKEDQQEENKEATLEGDESAASFRSAEQPGDDDIGEKDSDGPENKMEEVKEESSQPQEEEDIMDIPLDDPEANKAAAKIQAGFRGHMTRKKMKPEDKDGEEEEGAEEVSSTGDALNGSQGEPAEP